MSCKRSNTLLQKSLLLFFTWREYFNSQPKNLGYKQCLSVSNHSHPPYFMALAPKSPFHISIYSDQGMSIHGWFLVTM